jgi:TonB family protein
MALPTKDAVETANPVQEAPAAQTSAPSQQAAASSGHLRADAISLEVPIKVHGSRVTDVARGVAPRTEPFEEETNTMIVFPQGAVLRMSTAVAASQMLVMTNLKTRQDAICRVIKVRTFTNMQGYVEVEFTHKQPGYWGAMFASEGAAPAIPVAPAIPSAAPSVAAESSAKTSTAKKLSPSTPTLPTTAPPVAPAPVAPAADSTVSSVKPAAPPVIPAGPAVVPAAPAAFIPPSKPEPNFAKFGTQEEVQPAASATSTPSVKFVAPVRPVAPVTHAAPVAPVAPAATVAPQPPAAHAERATEPFVLQDPQTSLAAQALANAGIEIPVEPVAPPPTLSLSDLRGETHAATGSVVADLQDTRAEEKDEASVSAVSLAGSTHGTFGSFSGGAALGGSRAASADAFGARYDASSDAAIAPARPRGNNWLLIAACVGILFAGVFGGVFYFRTHSAVPTTSSVPKANSPAAPDSLAFQSPSAISEPPATAGNAAARNSAAHPIAIVTQSNAPAVSVNANSAGNGSGARVVPPTARITNEMVKQELDQHPVAPQRSDAAPTEAAPSVDAAPAADSSNSGALSGIISSNVPAPAAPAIAPEGPVKVGGNVKEPQLISRVLPEYPLLARQAGIQGDVVIKTTIDAKGHVVNTQVVSGPQMLREPALTALRRWRYEPSTLNGQPIAVQMLVTIKFRR